MSALACAQVLASVWAERSMRALACEQVLASVLEPVLASVLASVLEPVLEPVLASVLASVLARAAVMPVEQAGPQLRTPRPTPALQTTRCYCCHSI